MAAHKDRTGALTRGQVGASDIERKHAASNRRQIAAGRTDANLLRLVVLAVRRVRADQ